MGYIFFKDGTFRRKSYREGAIGQSRANGIVIYANGLPGFTEKTSINVRGCREHNDDSHNQCCKCADSHFISFESGIGHIKLDCRWGVYFNEVDFHQQVSGLINTYIKNKDYINSIKREVATIKGGDFSYFRDKSCLFVNKYLSKIASGTNIKGEFDSVIMTYDSFMIYMNNQHHVDVRYIEAIYDNIYYYHVFGSKSDVQHAFVKSLYSKYYDQAEYAYKVDISHYHIKSDIKLDAKSLADMYEAQTQECCILGHECKIGIIDYINICKPRVESAKKITLNENQS